MSEFMKDLLVNYLVILVFVFLVQLIYENYSVSETKRKFLMFGAMSLCIVFGMTFPFQIGEGLLFDLRLIPLMVGVLYGGSGVGASLFVVTAAYRFFIGGFGTWPSILTFSLALLALRLLHNSYAKWSSQKRIAAMTLFMGITTLSIFTVFLLFFSINIGPPRVWLMIIAANIFGALVLGILLETIRSSFRLREQVVQSEKLQLISQLAAAVSHEVRNPLTASRGFMQLLLTEGIDTESRNRFLNISISELDRAESIIRDYLTFAKPETEQLVSLYVPDEVKRMIDVITPLANMHNVHITSDVAACCIKGSPQLFTQGLLNISKNAIEAMPHGGSLILAAEQKEGTVFISLSDTGIGMMPEQVKRLGEPYYSTKGAKGTGLGMMVTYRIVEAMGGSIQVDSEPGKGTRFLIELPAHFPDQPRQVQYT
ncbi:ATP-binding protein [Ectobacillus ponti]|uniref:histidine kinase n=1 Tax=Ectobacillus ponti TaxID=2961894 RepID=A0AA41X469_9BACI|nr:ATP-binding protein [Ectobacillus ponti]MCP8968422.1 ATP-binding protein [Ectobacillus ponti]